MTKSQNLFKLRKWGNYSDKKTNWLLKEKGNTKKRDDEERKVLTATIGNSRRARFRK